MAYRPSNGLTAGIDSMRCPKAGELPIAVDLRCAWNSVITGYQQNPRLEN